MTNILQNYRKISSYFKKLFSKNSLRPILQIQLFIDYIIIVYFTPIIFKTYYSTLHSRFRIIRTNHIIFYFYYRASKQ